MRQVWPEINRAAVDTLIAQSAHGMAENAARRYKHALPLHRRRVSRRRRRLLLCGKPGVEVALALHNNDETHMGVLQTAKLRTLATINSSLIRFEHDVVGLCRDRIHFPSELRYPE